MSNSMLIRPVILCGGSGARLWPISSLAQPKQLLPLQSERTLLEETVGRVTCKEFDGPIVVTAAQSEPQIQDQLQGAGVRPAAIILEPEGRNTAAAVALACFFEARTAPDQLLLVMPSDHVIGDVEAFRAAVFRGTSAAMAGLIVTFGIRPTRPDTGYGYVRAGTDIPDLPGVREVISFVEKPDMVSAETYLSSGNYFWNGGIFLFKASAMIEELRTHAPQIASGCQHAMDDATADGVVARPEPESFLNSPSISIDYAVMEKTARACLVEADMDWSDLGSWNALWDISEKDENSNAVKGDVLARETTNSLIRNEGDATIVTLGLDGIVVVATKEKILVVPRCRSQDIKEIVSRFEQGDK